MRVKISANPPLPPLRAWFPVSLQGHATVSAFKILLCTSLVAFRDISPASLRLSIDGFELLDASELAVVRDGDLICVDVRDVQDATAAPHGATQTRLEPAPSRKRKRRMSLSSSSSSESDTDSATTSSESESSTSDSESMSDSGVSSRSLQKAEVSHHSREQTTPSVPAKSRVSNFVPPGYGKPQTRSRNLRRRIKRMHEREADPGPVSGSNAVVVGDAPGQSSTPDADENVHGVPTLMSLSLRNKNKARNFKSLIGKPLPAKIVFGDEEGESTSSGTVSQTVPPLVPPSMRSSLPPNLFVTSVDVEADLRRKKKKDEMHVESEATFEVDVDRLESMADERWATLAQPTREMTKGTIVGYKALGINPVTYTPEQVLTVARVVWCDDEGVVVLPLRAPVSFSGPVEEVEEEVHGWAEVSDWRVVE